MNDKYLSVFNTICALNALITDSMLSGDDMAMKKVNHFRKWLIEYTDAIK